MSLALQEPLMQLISVLCALVALSILSFRCSLRVFISRSSEMMVPSDIYFLQAIPEDPLATSILVNKRTGTH